MKLLLHEPDFLEDAQGIRHLVAGLVEVDDKGLLIPPEDTENASTVEDVAQPQEPLAPSQTQPEALAPMAG